MRVRVRNGFRALARSGVSSCFRALRSGSCFFPRRAFFDEAPDLILELPQLVRSFP